MKEHGIKIRLTVDLTKYHPKHAVPEIEKILREAGKEVQVQIVD